MLVENALAGHRNFHQSFPKSNESYGKMWAKEIQYENVVNIVDFALTVNCQKNYLDYFFGKEIDFQMRQSFADKNLRRSHTTIAGGFTFDTETTIKSLHV